MSTHDGTDDGTDEHDTDGDEADPDRSGAVGEGRAQVPAQGAARTEPVRPEPNVELSKRQTDLVAALQANPTITLTDLASMFDSTPNAIRVLIQRTEAKLGHSIRPRKEVGTPPAPGTTITEEPPPPLTAKTAERLSEVAATREAAQHAERVEAAKKLGEKPPPPPPEQSQKIRSVVLGQTITRGKDDKNASKDAAVSTADAALQAIMAGEVAKFSDAVISMILEAGRYAYAWWHTRGLSAEFPSPQAMIDQSISYWWNNRDEIDSLLGGIQLLTEERDDLQRRLEVATSRHTAISQVQSMIYLVAAEGTRLQPEIMAELLRHAENGSTTK